jgi:hypothetical protein
VTPFELVLAVLACWLVPVVVVAGFGWYIGSGLIQRLPNTEALEKFKLAVWKRYTNKAAFPEEVEPIDAAGVQNADRAITYLDRIIDRQINKVRGILPFNSIIIAALSIERSRINYGISVCPSLISLLHDVTILDTLTAIACLGYSSILCLRLFLVYWGPIEQYETFDAEVRASADVIRNRSSIIEKSVLISMASLFIAVLSVLLIEFGAALTTS